MSRDNTTLDDLFRILEVARASNEKAAAAYAQFSPADPGRLTMLNLGAYTYELLAETFCGNVPVSNFAASGSFVYGAPLTTDSLLRVAKGEFLQALAVAATDTQVADSQEVNYEIHRAQVGLARALTFEGRLDSAALVAANVPDGYADSIERSSNSPSENNGIYWYTNIEARYGVTSGEGINGLNFTIDGANGDPRINIGAPNIQTTVGLDDYTVDTIQQKYPTYGASGQLATAAEARLIQAEDFILNGSPGQALAQLNKARQDVSPGMMALGALPSDMASQIDTLFAERAYDLWMTGHREGDLRRLVRPTTAVLPGYGLAQTSVWPTGAYFKNGTYGSQVALLIPRGENENPQYTDAGCNGGLTP
jgi:hypothetical protein